MIERCPGCPVAGRCVVEWTNHRPYCDWAQRGGRWAAKVLELSEKGPSDLVAEATSRPTIQETQAAIARMKACEFWSPCKTGCGSGHCGLKKGKLVSHQECFACIKAYG